MSILVSSEGCIVGKSRQGIWLICKGGEASSLGRAKRVQSKIFWELKLVYSYTDVTSCVSKGKFPSLTWEASKHIKCPNYRKLCLHWSLLIK